MIDEWSKICSYCNGGMSKAVLTILLDDPSDDGHYFTNDELQAMISDLKTKAPAPSLPSKGDSVANGSKGGGDSMSMSGGDSMAKGSKAARASWAESSMAKGSKAPGPAGNKDDEKSEESEAEKGTKGGKAKKGSGKGATVGESSSSDEGDVDAKEAREAAEKKETATLPRKWRAYLDKRTNHFYYSFDGGAVTWTKPAPAACTMVTGSKGGGDSMAKGSKGGGDSMSMSEGGSIGKGCSKGDRMLVPKSWMVPQEERLRRRNAEILAMIHR